MTDADTISMRVTGEAGDAYEVFDQLLERQEKLAAGSTIPVEVTGTEKVADLGEKAKETGEKAKESGAAAGEMGDKYQKAAEVMGADSGKVGQLASVFGELTPAMFAGAAAIVAVTAALSESVSVAAEYEAQMDRAAAITGDAATAFTDLGTSSTAGSQQTLSQTGSMIDALANQGQKLRDQTNELKPAMELMDATGMGMQQTVTGLTNTLDKYAIESSKTSMVTNELVAASQRGKTSVGDLLSGLTAVGPAAQATGQDFDSMTTALGIMSESGLRGGEAGSKLSAVLFGLSKPSKDLAGGLSAIGVSTDDVNPSMHSLDEILTTLTDHGVTAGDAADLFGRRLGPGMAALLRQGGDEMRKYNSDIQNTDAASTAAETASSNFAGAQERLASASSLAYEAIGSKFLPALANVTDGAASAILKVLALSDVIGKFVDATQNSEVKNMTDSSGKLQWSSFDFAHNDAYRAAWSAQQTTAEDAGEDFAKWYSAGVKKADLPKMISDTYDDLDTQAKDRGKTAGGSWADSFSEEQVKQLEYQAGVNTINAANEAASYSHNEGKAITNDNNKRMETTTGQFELGEFLLNEDTGASAWQLRTQRWGTENLNPHDPYGDANQKMQAHLAEDSKTATSKFIQAAGGEPMAIDIANIDMEYKFDTKKSEDALKESITKAVSNADKSGIWKSKEFDTLQKNYADAITADPSLIIEGAQMLLGDIKTQQEYIANNLATLPGSTLNWQRQIAYNNKNAEDQILSDTKIFNTLLKESWDLGNTVGGLTGLISDKVVAVVDEMKPIGEMASEAFKNSFTPKMQEDLMGMEPILQELKVKAPEEFAVMGGDMALDLIQAIKDKNIDRIWEDLKNLAGRSFQETTQEWTKNVEKMANATETHAEGFKGSFEGATSEYDTYLQREKNLAGGLNATQQLTTAKQLMTEITGKDWSTMIKIKTDLETVAKPEVDRFISYINKLKPVVNVVIQTSVVASEVEAICRDAVAKSLDNVAQGYR